MEQEVFCSGYCRVLDESRMVAAVLENGCLTEVDCCYPDCIHAPNCTIAQAIAENIRESEKGPCTPV